MTTIERKIQFKGWTYKPWREIRRQINKLTMYNFNQQIEEDNKKFGYTGGNLEYFNIEDGNDNICRVMSPSHAYAVHFIAKGIKSPTCYGYDKGCPIREKNEDGTLSTRHARGSIRYVLYVLDRKDGKVKSAFFPYGVVYQIAALQKNPDYEFEDLPMPYDIRITYNKNEKDPKAKYRVEVKPNSAELTSQNLADLEAKNAEITLEGIVEKIKTKQMNDDEKNGRRVEVVALADEQAEYLAKARAADAIKNGVASTIDSTKAKYEYPKDEIRPEDIPF